MSPTKRRGAASFLKHAGDVASFYGFRPVYRIEEATNRRTTRRRAPTYSFNDAAAICLASTAGKEVPEPVLGFYSTPSPAHTPHGLAAREFGEFGLQVVGTPESIGEMVLIKTLTMILTEWGLPLERVRLNALGDRDSQQRFTRELSSHVRKHADRFEPACQVQNIKDPLRLYQCEDERCRAVASEAPRSIHFLSEKSRAHFRSLIEHVEQLGFPYELDDTMVGDDRGPHLVFALDFKDTDSTVHSVFGGRFDEHLRRETRRRECVGAGASILFRKKGATQSVFAALHKNQKPKVYFAQLGPLAKFQGLAVIDLLRSARVPVLHSFESAHLGQQLVIAREHGVSHLFIMGQREALDGTVIVRSMDNNAQSTIAVQELPKVLRSLK